MKIKIEKLRNLVIKSMLNKYNKQDSELMADVVMFGELSGRKSHGLNRLLIGSSILSMQPKSEPQIKNISKLSSLIIGNGNPGMLVGQISTNEVIRLAKHSDLGLVGTRGSFSSSGALSYYLEEITKNGLIGIIMADSPGSTAPFGGTEPLFGTNPIAFGFPTNGAPLIFDMGTSAITFGELLNARTLGKKLSEGVAVDSDGNVTTDPQKAIDGATLSFDNSYKGVGLAMVVEILAGVLPHSGYTGIDEETNGWGNFFMAFSPKLLSDETEFKERMTKMVERIRNSKTKDGSKVGIPGEKTLNTRDENLKNGEIEIEDKMYELLITSINVIDT